MAASTFVDGAAEIGYSTNQNNAENAVDREDGFIASVSGSVRHRILLGDGFGLQIGGRLEADGNERFGDLSRLGGGVNARLSWKPIVGFTAPWFALDTSVMLSEFNDSDIRDGFNGRIGLTAGKRITDRLSGRIGYNFDWREAFGGRAFDTRGHSLFASMSYRPHRQWVLYARYDGRSGDVVSTALPSNKIIAAAEVIEQDDAFGIGSVNRGLLIGPGPGPGPIGPGFNNNQRFAYRIDAISHQGRFGANYALARNMSLDLSARFRATMGDGDNDYQVISMQGAFLYRF